AVRDADPGGRSLSDQKSVITAIRRLSMTPSRLLLLGALAACVCLAAARADDEDEPSFAGKKLSYWLSQLTEGKDAKDRQRGVIGVEQIGQHGRRKGGPA